MSTSQSVDSPDSRLDDVARTVRALVEMMRSNGLTKLEVEVGDVNIRLRAGAVGEAKIVRGQAQEDLIAAVPLELIREPGHVVTAPMIGTFYTSAAPGDPPLVRLGDRVDAGQPIGIIEAMKIMNEIASDRAGAVVEILANNAQPVEYGSPLLRLSLDEDVE
jgi:acetyl-CoA carboxylase biotin carboxyl carrier protein